MNLQEIAKYVWENSMIIEFGGSEKWDLDTFSAKWLENKKVKRLNKAKGLYWFSIEGMSIEEIKELRKPQKLPERGADFSRIAKKMERIFGKNIREVENTDKKELIIYNGHASSVFDRVKTHFSLNNNKTGALGLAKYDLSRYKFNVRIFHIGLLGDENTEGQEVVVKKEILENLLNEKVGREAIEMAWRINYGWPILCEK